MRALLLSVLAASMSFAGCLGGAEGAEDPFAYLRKPVYASSFDLTGIGEGIESQEFRVTDGSIVSMRILLWINATAGGATVTFTNPMGSTVAQFSQSGEVTVPVQLGAWRVDVAGRDTPAGQVDVLILRA